MFRNNPRSCVISNVPDDLLLKIFSVNASDREMDEEDYPDFEPVTTTRCSSQVCRRWRHLILDSPSLWGKLLHLDELILASDDWKNEVLSRTKNAMLTVLLGSDSDPRKATPLLVKILKEEWPRIQHLEALIEDFHEDVWFSMQRPTENIRSISLRLPVQPAMIKPVRTSNVLFSAAQVPSLRSVTIRHLNFNLPPRWPSQLRELRLAGRFSPDIIINSLSAGMPFLEMLEISNSHAAGNPHPLWPTIILPRLKCLITRGPLTACLMLLDHILPSTGCGLDFASEMDVAEQDLSSSALQVLSRYIEGYLNTYKPFSIELSLSPTKFGFHNRRHCDSDIPPFDLRIENQKGISSTTMSLLFTPFIDCPFSGVSKFLFVAEHDLPFLPSDPNFSKFIALLSSVRCMDAPRPASLRYLSQIPTASGVAFFPSLQEVDLTARVYPSSVAPLTGFLLRLKSTGSSVQEVRIGYQENLEARGVNFSTLEQFSGLRVVYKPRASPTFYANRAEYICGSGTPEQLNFFDPNKLAKHDIDPWGSSWWSFPRPTWR